MIVLWTGSYHEFPPVVLPRGTEAYIGWSAPHSDVIHKMVTFTADGMPPCNDVSWARITDSFTTYDGPLPGDEDNLIFGFDGFKTGVGTYSGQTDLLYISLYAERTHEGTIERTQCGLVDYVKYHSAIPEPGVVWLLGGTVLLLWWLFLFRDRGRVCPTNISEPPPCKNDPMTGVKYMVRDAATGEEVYHLKAAEVVSSPQPGTRT